MNLSRTRYIVLLFGVILILTQFNLTWIINAFNNYITLIRSIRKEQTIFLPDINKGDPKPEPSKSDKQIFFTETTRINGGELFLNAREACAIESAARYHPNRDIYVVYSGPTYLNRTSKPSSNTSLYHVLRKNYQNVHFRSTNYEDIAKMSPVEGFTMYNESDFRSTHFSDILRLLLLWKYGGLYMDLDVVVLKPFDPLGQNFVSRISEWAIQCGTFDFSGTGIGQTVVTAWLEDMIKHFDGKNWNRNGIDMITAVMRNICETESVAQMNKEKCKGMQVLWVGSFLPLNTVEEYIDPRENNAAQSMGAVENAYTIHVYGHLLKDIRFVKDSKCVYTRVARQHCPKVYEVLDEYF